MDSVLPASLIQLFGSMATYIAILIVISITTKWFAIALVPLTVVYVLIQRCGPACARVEHATRGSRVLRQARQFWSLQAVQQMLLAPHPHAPNAPTACRAL